MSMAYIPSSYELNQYLDRARQEDGAKTIRKLTADELEAIHELGKQYKEFNRVIMELLVIINVLTRLRQTELYYIVANARRIIQSLARQRNKGYVIKKALAIVKPKDDVMPEIRRFIAVSRRRMDYIRQTIIPENLDLTPIKEYVKLIGAESFASAVYERFSEPRRIYAITSKEDAAAMDAYVDEMIETVRKGGMEQAYKERIQVYIRRADEIAEKREEEKRREKDEERMRLAEEGMMLFYRMFNNGVFTLKGDDRIKMGPEALLRAIDKFGRHSFCVLVCYRHSGKYVYHYLNERNEETLWFGKAWFYPNEAQAKEAMEAARKRYPKKQYDVVQLGYYA